MNVFCQRPKHLIYKYIYLHRLHTFREKGVREILKRMNVKRMNVMKKTYHLCLSAGDEVLFRDTEDYNRGFNSLSLALYGTGSTGLVESFMSNHCHMMVQTEDPVGLMHMFRQPYSKFFNCKYERSGTLGEKSHFSMEIVGIHHMLAAASYVLRNALHHGIVPIPYAYEHCSVNAIFQKEMGKKPEEYLLPEKSFYRYIGKRAEYPSHYRMSSKGVFLRESVLDIVQVENMYLTPRTFDYYMARRTGEDWTKEQEKDQNGRPVVRLEDIEDGIKGDSIQKMLINETGKNDYRRISDIDLCRLIDTEIISRYGKTSVYHLSPTEKKIIAEQLYKQFRAGREQITRCLAM